MSITKMRVFCSKYLSKWVFGGLILVFALLSANYFGGGGAGAGRDKSDEGSKIVATVNGKPITKAELDGTVMEQIKQAGGRLISPIQNNDLIISVLRQIMMDKMKVDAAEKEGVSIGFFEARREKSKLLDTYVDWIRMQVSRGEKIKLGDDEINRRLASGMPVQKQTVLPSGSVQVGWSMQRTSLDQLRDELDQQLTGDTLNNVLMMKKLDDTIKTKAGKVTDQQLEAVFQTIKARHILIRGASFPDPKAEDTANRVLAQINGGADFGALAKQYSQDPMTKTKGGEFPAPISGLQDKELQGLKKGETRVVKSPTFGGYRIINVEDILVKLPSDFVQRKAQYRDAVQTQLIDKQALDSFNRDMQSKARVEIKDQELKAYWIAYQATSMPDPAMAQKVAAQAVDMLLKASRNAIYPSAVQCRLAQMYLILGNDDKALAAMKYATDTLKAVGADISLFLAQLYVKKGNRQDALTQLDTAGKIGYADKEVHTQMEALYTKMGEKELAAKEKKWLDDIAKREQATQPTSVGPSKPAGGATPPSPSGG